jgi:transcriptional regulator with XRE-family HTH domain
MQANGNEAVGQAAEVRGRRRTAGLSQERLARLADCSTSTVRLVEGGWRASEEMLKRLADALDRVEGAADE